MDSYTLNGEKYYYNNGRWLTSNYSIAPSSLTSQLNKLLLNKEDILNKSVEELIKIIDGSRQSGNIQLAIKASDRVLKIANSQDIRRVLPRVTSLYRKLGKPQQAINIADEYLSRYEKKVWSPALFTSMAAAYCDLNDLKQSREYADRAKALSKGEESQELINVYSRLKRLGG